MSDEYGRAGFNKDNLADDSANTRVTLDERTKNYPPEGDTTSSGGYSSTSDVWTDKAQRGNTPVAQERDGARQSQSNTNSGSGLIDQSLSGSDLSGQLRDAKQGSDLSMEAVRGGEKRDAMREDLGPGA
ncbi:hypothetical protein D9758_016363 [Tetrapyrgos nigripes]|uniref:Uncharacterized protein n=1 Tax=Tetrapyrgos nigripes TaxID=182062 RepID=A0A8H5CD09_9AGAR|nr:hypothetical protein D9758_016363 [Tetrapyrgos nigripes]